MLLVMWFQHFIQSVRKNKNNFQHLALNVVFLSPFFRDVCLRHDLRVKPVWTVLQIFITYIDTALPRMLRRAWLFKSFNFWCQCRRCKFEGDQPTVCTLCGAKAQVDKKFPTCGKCHKAWYCSTKCQRQAWSQGHKVICQTKHSIVANPQDYEVC